MSALTIYDPRKYLTNDLKSQIESVGIDLDDYVSTIESKLRARGLLELRDNMLCQIDEQLHNARQARERRKGY